MNHALYSAAMMRESAVLALKWAGEHCRAEPGGKPDCGWYHGFWQIARALGVGKFAGGHSQFLLETLRQFARTGEYRRVLVSGTADHAMPALVYQAYGDESVELTVVDWCETPLALTRWYADRIDRRVRTVRADVLGLRGRAEFDLVLTNSFLGYFAAEQRPLLFRVWADLLRSGGKVVTTNRVRPTPGAGLVGFGAAEAQRFCDQVEELVALQGAAFDIDDETIRAGAREYVRRFSVHPVTSRDEVTSALLQSGFDHVEADTAQSDASRRPVSGPSTTEQGAYVRIVATRT